MHVIYVGQDQSFGPQGYRSARKQTTHPDFILLPGALWSPFVPLTASHAAIQALDATLLHASTRHG